jgi:hypothetical protein
MDVQRGAASGGFGGLERENLPAGLRRRRHDSIHAAAGAKPYLRFRFDCCQHDGLLRERLDPLRSPFSAMKIRGARRAES